MLPIPGMKTLGISPGLLRKKNPNLLDTAACDQFEVVTRLCSKGALSRTAKRPYDDIANRGKLAMDGCQRDVYRSGSH